MSSQTQNKNNKIGNGNRTIEFETEQLKKIFPQVQEEDFFKLPNRNKAVRLVFETKSASSNIEFEILIEFLYDYPNSPPNVHVIRPDITGAPHTLFSKRMCYNNPSLDWKISFTSYEVVVMIQGWIYAYCKWLTNGKWDWYQDVEYIPASLPRPPPVKQSTSISNITAQSKSYMENNDMASQNLKYHKTPLHHYYSIEPVNSNNQSTGPGRTTVNNDESLFDNLQSDKQNHINNTTNYGRTPVDNEIGEIGTTFTSGRIVFAILFSLAFIAYNHWTTLVVLPFFALLFISNSTRTMVFILLSLLFIISNSWSFVVVPLFGSLYTFKKGYQIAIWTAIVLFWIAIAVYGNNIVDIKIF